MNKHHQHKKDDKHSQNENENNKLPKEEVNNEDNNENIKKYDDLNDKYIRLLAEFENFKKRNIKERLELISTANQDIVMSLLSVLDDFDRASLTINIDDTNNNSQYTGFLLIQQKLKKILEQKGLKEMEIEKNSMFNPELHEAIANIETSDDNKNKIIEVTEKGYYLNTKLIRHAKVVVGK